MKLRVSLCQFWALFNKMLIVFELDWHENTAQRGASVSRCCRGCWVRWRWFMGDLSWSTNTQHEARCSTISLDPSITLKTVWVVKWKVLFIKLTDFLFEQTVFLTFSFLMIPDCNADDLKWPDSLLHYILTSYRIKTRILQTNVIKTDEKPEKTWDGCMSTMKLDACVNDLSF